MSGLAERAALHEMGLRSEFMEKLMDVPGDMLCEEQLSLMALICEKLPTVPTDAYLASFVNTVRAAQDLMPGNGTIRSRQVLVTLALLASQEV